MNFLHLIFVCFQEKVEDGDTHFPTMLLQLFRGIESSAEWVASFLQVGIAQESQISQKTRILENIWKFEKILEKIWKYMGQVTALELQDRIERFM